MYFTPFVCSDHVLPKMKADEIRRINVEQERAKKWARMIEEKKWPKFKNSEKLRSRVYKGIPDKMRVSVWKLLLDLDIIRKQQEGKYQVRTQLNCQTAKLLFDPRDIR